MSKKKILATQIICTFMLVLMMGVSVFADKVTAPKFDTVTLYGGGTGLPMLTPENVPLKAKNIRIANTKIATFTVVQDSNEEAGTYDVIYIEPVKKGTTTLKFDLTVNGKKKSYKVKIQVKGYVNPFTSLKIGSVNYAGKFGSANNSNFCHVSTELKGKLSIKLKSGWHLTPETGIYKGRIWEGALKKKVNNNTSVAVGYEEYLSIGVWHSKSGYATTYIIGVLPKTTKKVTAPDIPKEVTLLTGSEFDTFWMDLVSAEGDPLEVKDVKSSNTKVVEVKSEILQNYGKTLNIKAKKTGTAKVSFKLKINGTWKSYSTKIRACAYKNPFSSLKIGNKNFASKFGKTNYYTTGQLKGKLTYKLKSGFKLKEIQLVDKNTWQPLKKNIKKNTQITVKKGMAVLIMLRNTKQKYDIGYVINVK